MKRFLFSLLLALPAGLTHAQTDMITALQSIGDKVVYTEYWDVTPVPGGKNTIGEKRYVVTLHTVTNKFGKVVGFDAIDTKEAGKKRIEYYYMHGSFDHYTHPSMFFKKSSSIAYVIINGVIFELEKFKDANTFEIDKLWIPSVPKERSGDAVFNGAKMSDLRSADLQKMVTDYLNAMKKVQEANPYSEPVQVEVDAMKFAVDSTQLTYNNANAAYWNSPEGQKKLNQLRKPRVTLVNDTGADLLMCYGQGVSTTLKPGEKKDFSCDNGKIFKGAVRPNSTQLDNTGKVLIDLNGTNCGITINASTLK
jgi:hypothetical protein